MSQHQVPASPQAAAHALLGKFPGCQLVATTLGPHGSLLTTRESTFGHPGFPIKLVDTVGAGDAFTAGLVHAYLRGASPAPDGGDRQSLRQLCGRAARSYAAACRPSFDRTRRNAC